jgi:hypothetical protein
MHLYPKNYVGPMGSCSTSRSESARYWVGNLTSPARIDSHFVMSGTGSGLFRHASVSGDIPRHHGKTARKSRERLITKKVFRKIKK